MDARASSRCAATRRLKAYYERLRARGKLPKVALVACMRKLLLTAVYSVAKSTAVRSYPSWWRCCLTRKTVSHSGGSDPADQVTWAPLWGSARGWAARCEPSPTARSCLSLVMAVGDGAGAHERSGWKGTPAAPRVAMSSRHYAISGAVFGMGFPVLGTVLDAITRHGALPFGQALIAAQGSPLLWLVDTAPVVLGVMAALVGRRQDEVASIGAVRRKRFEHTAGELFGSAQALVSAVSSFSSMTTQTAASVRQTTATMEQIGHTATQAALTAETVVVLTRASRAALGEVHSAVLPASGAILAGPAAAAAGPSMQKLASTIEESSGAARAIAQMATQQDRGIDEVLKALNEILPRHRGDDVLHPGHGGAGARDERPRARPPADGAGVRGDSDLDLERRAGASSPSIGFPRTARGRAAALRASRTLTGSSAFASSTSTRTVVAPGPTGQTWPRASPRQTASSRQRVTTTRPCAGCPSPSRARTASGVPCGSSCTASSRVDGAISSRETSVTDTGTSAESEPTVQRTAARPCPVAVTFASLCRADTVATRSSLEDQRHASRAIGSPFRARGVARTVALWPRAWSCTLADPARPVKGRRRRGGEPGRARGGAGSASGP